jgi:hypothetical protein
LNDGRIQNPSNPFGIVPLSRFVPRGFGFVHHSIVILYHEVPNPNLTIRNFFIAVGRGVQQGREPCRRLPSEGGTAWSRGPSRMTTSTQTGSPAKTSPPPTALWRPFPRGLRVSAASARDPIVQGKNRRASRNGRVSDPTLAPGIIPNGHDPQLLHSLGGAQRSTHLRGVGGAVGPGG